MGSLTLAAAREDETTPVLSFAQAGVAAATTIAAGGAPATVGRVDAVEEILTPSVTRPSRRDVVRGGDTAAGVVGVF